MASNDPTDTGGLFIGRRPGTAPVRYREVEPSSERRRSADNVLAYFLLAVEMLLCLTLFGPQPLLTLLVFLPPSAFEAWFVSLAHTPEDLDRTLEAADSAPRREEELTHTAARELPHETIVTGELLALDRGAVAFEVLFFVFLQEETGLLPQPGLDFLLVVELFLPLLGVVESAPCSPPAFPSSASVPSKVAPGRRC